MQHTLLLVVVVRGSRKGTLLLVELNGALDESVIDPFGLSSGAREFELKLLASFDAECAGSPCDGDEVDSGPRVARESVALAARA